MKNQRSEVAFAKNEAKGGGCNKGGQERGKGQEGKGVVENRQANLM